MLRGIHCGVVKAGDGVRLAYVEAGDGPDLLLVAGWTLTTELWPHQLEEFARTHHVVAYDHRGHGRSQDAGYRYRGSRFAADARDVITSLRLSDVAWVGHSIGCAVAWAHRDLFGDAALRGPQGGQAIAAVFERMTTRGVADADREVVIGQARLMRPQSASTLMFDHAMADWRDVLPRITVPTQIIGGEASMFPADGIRNLGKAIPGSQVVMIAAAEGGSHLAFYENPGSVNAAIRAFLDTTGS